MNIFLSTLFVFLSIYENAFSGQETGHGGFAWVCGKYEGDVLVENIPIDWISLVDLYDPAINIRNTDLNSTQSAKTLLRQALNQYKQLDPIYTNTVSDIAFMLLNELEGKTLSKPAGSNRIDRVSSLSLTYDLLPSNEGYPRLPIPPKRNTCNGHAPNLIPVAKFFSDPNDYYLSGEILAPIWEHPKFTNRNKAALILHEAIFSFRHATLQENDSTTTRYLVNQSFYGQP